MGIESGQLPARSPNLNAVAERSVRSIRESCLSQLVLIGESSLRRSIDEFVTHDHQEKNHQGLGNKIIRPEFTAFPSSGQIACRERLGGMLRYCYRQAA
jgi:putative transposase